MSLTFFTIGDWGTPTIDQPLVAEQMGIFAELYSPSFLIALGDNFYESGVSSISDVQWQNTYQNVYSAPALQIPWYPILGNHDWKGNASAQVLYQDGRWTMSDFNYSLNFEIDTYTSLKFVFIDTVIMAPIESINLISPDPVLPDKGPHYTWFENQLSSSSSSWLIVTGHYPVYSAGSHGDTDELVNELNPLLKQYNVTSYIAGHSHNMQHLKKNGVDYFVSGNGAKRGSITGINADITKFAVVDPGFSIHTLTANTMTTLFVNGQGEIIYNYTRYRNVGNDDDTGDDDDESDATHFMQKSMQLIVVVILCLFSLFVLN